MASLDSKGEIVSIELLNPEETQLRKSENDQVDQEEQLPHPKLFRVLADHRTNM